METTNSVTINTTEGTQPTPEQMVEDAHRAELERQQKAQDEGRPDWLPEKFSSPEDMAKAYSELEKKQSKETAEKPKPIPQPTREEAEEAGLDMAQMEQEFLKNGELSEASYEAAEKAGYSREIVDNYIEGRQAVVAREAAQIYESVGGQEAYGDLLTWASDNLTESEIDSFNATISSNDVSSIQLAVRGLKARYDNEQTSEPQRNIGGGEPPSGDVYESWQQVQADMRDPRYKKDSAFNRKVTEKLGRSQL